MPPIKIKMSIQMPAKPLNVFSAKDPRLNRGIAPATLLNKIAEDDDIECDIAPATLLHQISQDDADWRDMRNYPSTQTCRRMIALGDVIAKNPVAWETIKLAARHPDWSYRKIGVELNLDHKTVARYLEDIRIPVECFFIKKNLGIIKED